MSWKEAYLRQAKSDYIIFKEFSKTNKPQCHQLHYLQMFTEKLAKSYLCPSRNKPPRITHFVLVTFLRQCKRNPDIRDKLGFKNRRAYFSSYIDDLMPLAYKIQELAPVGSQLGRANPEYPWITNKGEVIPPIDHNFNNFTDNRIMAKFLMFIYKLIQMS